MTTGQITAVNNGMSMLADLYQTASMMTSLEDYKEYTNKHIKALRDSGVDNNIVEHFESLCYSCLPVAENAVRQHERYMALFEEEMEREEMSSYATPEEDLAALQELKAKLFGHSIS